MIYSIAMFDVNVYLYVYYICKFMVFMVIKQLLQLCFYCVIIVAKYPKYFLNKPLFTPPFNHKKTTSHDAKVVFLHK